MDGIDSKKCHPTISATHCNGSADSVFSNPSQIIPATYVGDLPGGIPVHLEQHLPHPFRCNCFEYFDNPIDPSLLLLSRGWVYQEAPLLSRRHLHQRPAHLERVIWSISVNG